MIIYGRKCRKDLVPSKNKVYDRYRCFLENKLKGDYHEEWKTTNHCNR